MKRIFICSLVVVLGGQPVWAQDDNGPSLMERGAQQFLEGLLKEMEPAFEGMRGFMDEMGPAMMEILEDVKDWSRYEPPEVLENGDIIIRRKPEQEPVPEVAPPPDEPLPPQIEL